MTEVNSILSGKGGTGKTFTAANLSLAFQDLGDQVVCIDTDINSPNLGLQIGHVPDSHTLEDVLKEEVNPLKAISVHDSGLLYVPASLHLSDEKVSGKRLGDMVGKFSKFADRVIIDAPPGFGESFHDILEVSDKAFVVTNPELQAVKDARKVVDAAEKRESEVEGMILNKFEELPEEMDESEIEAYTGADVLMKIPHHREVKRSVHRGEPVALDRHSEVGNKFKELAADITGREFREPWYSGLVRALRKMKRG